MEKPRNIYKGNRYVPKIMGEWDKLKKYEGLSIVLNEGNSYTSKKSVPVGIELTNETYWSSTGNYNVQIENYRAGVTENKKGITDLTNSLNTAYSDIAATNVKIADTDIEVGKNKSANTLTNQYVSTINRTLKNTENNIVVTRFMSALELEDIKLSEPLLDHSNSIQAYVDYMISENNFVFSFPSGHFRFKNINLGDKSCLVKGDTSGSGYIHNTFFTIISEDVNDKGFYGSNRQISFINFNAKSSGTKTDLKNTSFYVNNIEDGCFFTASNLQTSFFSGDVFRAYDLIDSEFYKIRVTNNKNVFNFKPKKWVRSTTVTFDKVYGELNDKIFDVPFCSQSKIVDCIFEHGGLGTITDGSWTIDNLYLEKNTGDLDATNSLLTKLYVYSFEGGKILNTQEGVSNIDKGHSSLSWKGITASEVKYDTKKPLTIITGNYSSNTWTKLGNWEPNDKGARMKINILGTNNWTQSSGAEGQTGETIVHLMHGINTNAEVSNAVGFAYHTGGNKPIVKVKVVATQTAYRDKFEVFVLVSTNSRYVGIDYELTGGVFIPNVVTNVSDPGVNVKTILDVPFEFRIQTNTGAFSINESGGLTFTAPVESGGAMGTTAKSFLPIIVNGTTYKLPLL